MAARTFDCVVIGAGPGGYVAAIRAAQLGMATAVVERGPVGGRCLNVACIPAKAVLRAADILSEVREAGDFGIVVAEPSVDFSAVMARREKVVSTLTGGVSGLFKKNKIELIAGEATLTAQGTVRVGDDELSAKAIVLATGSVPRAVPGIEFGGRVVGTEEAWAFAELPARLAVLGAGPSGSEIASAYARLGSETHLFEVLDRVLPTEDEDISKIVGRGLSRQGIAVHTGTGVETVKGGKNSVTLTAAGEQIEVDWLVLAVGRGPDVEGLGLEAAGVKLGERGLIEVDGAQRTSREGVYAIGDLVSGPALAHKASDEGIIAVENAAGLATHPLVHIDIPRATFCTPNVGSFGLTEAQAREAGHDVVIGKVPYGAVGAGTIYGDRSGIVKLIGERLYGELLGAHISEAVMEAARDADGWLIHG
ncbi:MAG: dihydrolipoyl dehydrogenase [Solirubrobacteraceae bacterium]